MTNHIHLLAIPDQEDSLSRTLRYVHGRFAQYANAELTRCGHLWQNRYYSCPIEAGAADAVAAYVELNPVRAGLSVCADEFDWSSAAVHTGLRSDRFGLLDQDWWRCFHREPSGWKQYLETCDRQEAAIRRATFTGRPLGSDDFVRDLEARLERTLARQRSGPKPRPRVLAGQAGLFG